MALEPTVNVELMSVSLSPLLRGMIQFTEITNSYITHSLAGEWYITSITWETPLFAIRRVAML